MISGVVVTPLRRIVDQRGSVMHMLRSDAAHFVGFGEIYFSTINPGVTKGWHCHSLVTANYAVPQGTIRLVLFDERADSATTGQVMEMVLGGENYRLVTIPPGVWSAFGCQGEDAAMVANCTDRPHDPSEGESRPLDDPRIPFDWAS